MLYDALIWYIFIYQHSIFAILQFEILRLMNLDFTGYSWQKNPVHTLEEIEYG